MKALLVTMGRYLEGRSDDAPPGTAIYRQFCAAHRYDALVYVYAATARALGDRFPALVEAYFRARPMWSVELNENGALFADFLRTADVPAFVPELADFEWWEWRTLTAREPENEGSGLRIAPLVELRPYRWNFLSGAPRKEELVVVFWRDRDDDLRRERATHEELLILQAVHRGDTPPPSETLDDLIAAGILRV